MDKTWIIAVLVFVSAPTLSRSGKAQCPTDKGNLRRLGETRFFVIHNTTRGDFVNFTSASELCLTHGLKMATIKNLTTMAVVSTQLENLVYDLKLKDTWYWLDAKFNETVNQYFWENNTEPLEYNLYLYREPRPIGVGAHITYLKEYQPKRNRSQCITLALPWPGAGDPRTEKYVYGHQTTMDEKHCESEMARHAICESTDIKCNPKDRNPFELTEDKGYYFNDGNWIFGERKYIINFNQRSFENSTNYCESKNLHIMSPGNQEKHLIPHMKMWTRALKATQYWTSLKYKMSTRQFVDKNGKPVSKSKLNINFTEDFVDGRSSKSDETYCVAMTLAYEYPDQMPCNETQRHRCSWSFIRYSPANCLNRHGSICQHSDYNKRQISWNYKDYKENLTQVLRENAMTKEFGFPENEFLLRSKYKQTFGLLWCPPGYRMLRGGGKNDTQKWSKLPRFINSNTTYKYDYLETYWVVDKDLFNKSVSSQCTISYFDEKNDTRSFKSVPCTNYHFYLCEKIKVGINFQNQLDVLYQTAEPMRWKKGPQPRNYPIACYPDLCTPHYNNSCDCKGKHLYEYNTVSYNCIGKAKNCTANLFDPGMCRRGGPHVLYSIAGVQCYNHESSGNCDIEKTMLAVNFYHGKHTDDLNITYLEAKKNSEWGDPYRIWEEYNCIWSLKSYPKGEKLLYMGQLSGQSGRLTSGRTESCIYFLIPLDGDGMYEISFKTGEFGTSNWRKTQRHYSVLLNGQYIFRNLEMLLYYNFGYGFHINALFEIVKNGTSLKLHGHPRSEIMEPYTKLNFSFCLGECRKIWKWTNGDPNIAMSAFSVVKLKNGHEK